MKTIGILFISIFLLQCTSKQDSSNSNRNSNKLTPEDMKQYAQKGKEIAQASFKAMSSELKSAMKSGGPVKAVDYCSVEAYPLTDSLSQTFDARIRRTSLKFRNPKNEPTEMERTQLMAYQKDRQENIPLVPKVFNLGDHVLTTIPISMKSECLACHGTLDSSLPHVKLISDRYPNDKAMGYSEGDLRGMWSIRFNKP